MNQEVSPHRTGVHRVLPSPWVFLAGVVGVVIALPAIQIWWRGRMPLRPWLALTIVWAASIACLAAGLFETRRDRWVAGVLATAGLALVAAPLLGGAFSNALAPVESTIWNWEGKKAADFTLRSLDGRTVRLSQFRGKVVLIHVWRPEPSLDGRIFPYLAYAARVLGPDGLVVLSISSASPQVQQQVREQFGLRHLMLFDDGEAPAPFNKVRLLNFGFVIDRQGRIEAITAVSGLAALHDLARLVRGPAWNASQAPIVAPPAAHQRGAARASP